MKKIALIAALLLVFTCVSPAAFAETGTVDTILTAGTTQAFTDEALFPMRTFRRSCRPVWLPRVPSTSSPGSLSP